MGVGAHAEEQGAQGGSSHRRRSRNDTGVQVQGGEGVRSRRLLARAQGQLWVDRLKRVQLQGQHRVGSNRRVHPLPGKH